MLQIPQTSAYCPSESPTTSQPSTSDIGTHSDLLIEIQRLRERVHELEKISSTALCHQADKIIKHTSVITQGPNSLEGFHQMDLDQIVTELRTHAPDLYYLCMTLGDTKRNTNKDDEVTTEDIKAISSMCSLLNACSSKIKGLQLLMSIMLVARATSRQVYSTAVTIVCPTLIH